MKKIIFVILLAAISLSTIGCQTKDPASTDQNNPKNIVYFNEGTNYPSYNTWENILSVSEVKSYELIGTADASIDGNQENYQVSSLNTLEKEGFIEGKHAFKLLEGENIKDGSTGTCLAPNSVLRKLGKKIGDTITVDTGFNITDYKIVGSFGFRDEGSAQELDEMLNLVYTSFHDFKNSVDLDETGHFMAVSATCKSEEDAKNIIETTNTLLLADGINARSAVELPEDELNIKKIEPIDGTDFDQNPIEGTILEESGITMLNMWGTFCNPCIKEMPDLGEIHREYAKAGKKFKVIGICTDINYFDGKIDEGLLRTGKEIVEKTKADYQHILPGEVIRNGFLSKITAVPTTLFVNDKGEVLKTVVGARTKNQFVDIIDELLNQLQ